MNDKPSVPSSRGPVVRFSNVKTYLLASEWGGYNGALSMTQGQELFLLVSRAMEIESIKTLDWGIFWRRVLVDCCRVVSAFSGPWGQRLTVTRVTQHQQLSRG